MTRAMKLLIVAGVAIYYIAANLTGAYYANHRCNPDSFDDCTLGSPLAGILWPLYWPARISLEVTQ
ncbi:hypothetical protein KNLIENLN_00035 [Sinorhizobium phage NV1.1.1]|nr:hypothetical protein KNLIENLN_00035 [Sinorhizobium phage NV1.1.1]